ncbi:hypothetical protein [Devosia sp.]|uniref:hypothetical protein n=1 Tax=Devosia sp. TaxID=1871048 RepID=UPI003F6EA023
MQAYVIDSNMLQSGTLRGLLAEGDNLAILPDFAWYEIYKQASIEGLRLGLSVIGDYPERVVLLRPGDQIARLDPSVADEVDRLILDGPIGDIRETVRIARSTDSIEPLASAGLHGLWEWARTLRPSLIEGASDIALSFPEMEEQMFSRKEVRIIRTNWKYTPDMFGSIFGASLQIWENLATAYDIKWQRLDESVVCRTYLFRFALGIVILLLWWIRCGSQPVVRLGRMSNDLIDLSFAVYATYFDGFVTQDEKASWLHANLVQAIMNFQAMTDSE